MPFVALRDVPAFCEIPCGPFGEPDAVRYLALRYVAPSAVEMPCDRAESRALWK